MRQSIPNQCKVLIQAAPCDSRLCLACHHFVAAISTPALISPCSFGIPTPVKSRARELFSRQSLVSLFPPSLDVLQGARLVGFGPFKPAGLIDLFFFFFSPTLTQSLNLFFSALEAPFPPSYSLANHHSHAASLLNANSLLHLCPPPPQPFAEGGPLRWLSGRPAVPSWKACAITVSQSSVSSLLSEEYVILGWGYFHFCEKRLPVRLGVSVRSDNVTRSRALLRAHGSTH